MAGREWKLADTAKRALSKQAEKNIASLYSEAAAELERKFAVLDKTGFSGRAMELQLQYQKAMLEQEVLKLQAKMGKNIEAAAKTAAQEALNAEKAFASMIGIKGAEHAFMGVADDIVASIMSGNIYKGGWDLSKAIWGMGSQTKASLERIVAGGIAQGKSVKEISKQLVKYVDSSKTMDWKIPGTSIRTEYNAQRLTRTMIQHAFQQGLNAAVSKNPWVDGIEWHSVFAEGRTCELCMSRDRMVYPKDDWPLDHPMGLCYFTTHMEKDMNQIADELADWANGADNPAIDEYAASLFRSPGSELAKMAGLSTSSKLDVDWGKTLHADKAWYDAMRAAQVKGMAVQLPKDILKSLGGRSNLASALAAVKNKATGYVGTTNFHKIQALMRGTTDTISAGSLQTIKTMGNVLKYDCKLKTPLTVIRYVDEKQLINWGVKSIDDVVEGRLLRDAGFTSVSTKASSNYFAKRPIELRIRLRKGTPAFNPSHWDESELILRNNQQFKVVSKHSSERVIKVGGKAVKQLVHRVILEAV